MAARPATTDDAALLRDLLADFMEKTGQPNEVRDRLPPVEKFENRVRRTDFVHYTDGETWCSIRQLVAVHEIDVWLPQTTSDRVLQRKLALTLRDAVEALLIRRPSAISERIGGLLAEGVGDAWREFFGSNARGQEIVTVTPALTSASIADLLVVLRGL